MFKSVYIFIKFIGIYFYERRDNTITELICPPLKGLQSIS